MTSDSSHMRLGVLGIAALSLFGALFARLWFLQIVSVDDLRVSANSNRVRVVRIQAPRGRILDRNGMVIVDNRPSIVVTVDWQRFTKMGRDDRNGLLDRLAIELTHANPVKPVTAKELARRVDDPRSSHFRPVPVAEDVSEEMAIFLAEHREDFPTFTAARVMVRNYRYGSLLSHVLGYVGALSDKEWKGLDAHNDRQKPYEQNDEIGKSGIESTMESALRGTPGEVSFEVDARNRPVREISRRDPRPGDDLYLTIDMRLQAATEESLQAGLLRARLKPTDIGNPPAPAGSSVVLDPRNAQVLAMASYPTFNPGELTNGVSSARYRELTAAGTFSPLTNRVIQGTYAPGSTFKLATAYAALKTGLLQPTDVIQDPGFFEIPNCGGDKCRKFNSGRKGHGSVDVARALTVSSDVFFYRLGFEMWAARDRLGPTALQAAVRDLGFDDKTGVQLPGELRGRIPTPAWKREFDRALHGRATEAGRWQGGDNPNVAVGQGDVLVTPLQIANAYAAFGNGGTLYRPSVVLKVTAARAPAKILKMFQPKVVRRITFPPGAREAMLAGFAGVTTASDGTATPAFQGFPTNLPVAGKTGTAQVGDDPKTHLPRVDNSLFAGFAPVVDPQYLGVTVIEGGGFGSDAAAPVVRNILEPVANNALPPVPAGGVFNPEDVLKLQKNPGYVGPND